MADISQVKLPNGDTYNLVDETSGYIKNYTETDPIFSASAAAGITVGDIAVWNNANSLQWNSTSKALRVNKNGSMTTIFEQGDLRYNSSTNTTGFLTLSDLPIYDGTVV